MNNKRMVDTGLSWSEAEKLWGVCVRVKQTMHEIRLVGNSGKWSVLELLSATNNQPIPLSVKF